MDAALYLIPCTLGDTPLEQVLPAYNAEVIRQIRHFVVEEIRTARRFLRRVDKAFPIDDSTFYEMGKRAAAGRFASYLAPLDEGHAVGVISEAGCPAVADPGADIVSIAQRRGFRVVPLVGPNSMIMAVMASGLNGQSFAFNGYLPVEVPQRIKALKKLEQKVQNENQTQLFIETPYRNAKMIETILNALNPKTKLCIAAGITCAEEYIKTRTVAEWKKEKIPELGKIPAIFVIGK